MNRQFRGQHWTFNADSAQLIYTHFRALVAFPTPTRIIWTITDDTPDMFHVNGRIVASGTATGISRACFMCETWIEGATRGKS